MARFFSGLFVLVLLAGCATVPRPVHPPGEVPALQLCRKFNIDCSWDAMGQSLAMVYQGKKIQGMVGSAVIISGTDRILLSAPLTRRHGAVILPPDFERAVLGPVPVRQDDAARGARQGVLHQVVLDAGHGGKDPGAIGIGGIQEKTVVLDIARRMREAFKEKGIAVIMTRDDDSFPSLQERTAMASQPGADLFISIHANSVGDKVPSVKNRRVKKGQRASEDPGNNCRAHGIEVYYAGPLSPEDSAEVQRASNEKLLASRMNMQRDNADLREIVADMLYSYKLSFSPGLADEVSRGFSQENLSVVRGSKTARFFVLRNTLVPAVLVEVGFLSNPRESARLRSPEYRQKIADIVVKSILRRVYEYGL